MFSINESGPKPSVVKKTFNQHTQKEIYSRFLSILLKTKCIFS